MPDGSNAATKLQPPPQDLSVETPAKLADPLHDVITLLNRVSTESKLALLNPDLAGMVDKLAEQAMEPGRLDQPSYRTGAAYAVQDMEKYTGGQPIGMPPELRAELVTLASTSPGLQDERMQALVAKTAGLDDRELILDIRRTAQQAARLDPQQDGPEVIAKIEALEKRAGLVRSPDISTSNDDPALQAGQKAAMPAGQDRPAAEQTVAVSTSDAANKVPPAKEAGTPAGAASIEQRVNAVPSPGSGQPQATATVEAAAANRSTVATVTTQPATSTAAGQPRPQVEAVQTQSHGVAERIVSSTRNTRSLDPAPWSVPVPAIGQRIAQFEQRLADGKTERLVQNGTCQRL